MSNKCNTWVIRNCILPFTDNLEDRPRKFRTVFIANFYDKTINKYLGGSYLNLFICVIKRQPHLCCIKYPLIVSWLISLLPEYVVCWIDTSLFFSQILKKTVWKVLAGYDSAVSGLRGGFWAVYFVSTGFSNPLWQTWPYLERDIFSLHKSSM